MSGEKGFRIGLVAAALGFGIAGAVAAQTIPLGPATTPSRTAPSPTSTPYARHANLAPTSAGRNDVAAPRLTDLSPQPIGLLPLTSPRTAARAEAPAVGNLAAPQPSQPSGYVGNGGRSGQVLAPSLVPMLAAATPLAYAVNPPRASYGAGSVSYGSAPARSVGGGEGQAQAGTIEPEILQPTVLEQPKEFAPPGQLLPVLALDEATLLGGVARTLETPQPTGVATGLADDALTSLPNGSLALASLAWEDGRGRLADLSLKVIPYGPPGPEAALGGFAPWRVLPWPNLGQRAGGARPAPAAAPEIPGYNPFTYGSSLGLALNAFSQIGAHLGAGLAPSTQLPQLPGLPAPPRY